ncbi:MAG: DUF4190 domain-containing protein [Spirochaetaceae bacterium]|jgi:flagellar basal body-associated protein FliL|nr:DUF4190 domain-containing protein [Spirochaetaceae bacterium]
MDIAGLVLGILSTVLSFMGIGLVFGIIGIPLSAISRSRAKKDGKSTGIAIAGIVLNSIGIAVSIIFLIVIVGSFIVLNDNNSIASESQYENTIPQYETFTHLGIMRVNSKEQHTVLLDIVLEYNQNINDSRIELNAKVDKMKDFIRQYFATKNASDLIPENENKIKQEIMELLNTECLDIAQISGVLFKKFEVMEY